MMKGPVWLMQPIPYFGEKIEGLWIYEPKIDGWRMQILHYPDGRIECWGRRLERRPNWTGRLAAIGDSVRANIPSGTLLDCELFSSGGRRLVPSLFARRPKAQPIIHVFDIVFYKGKDVSRMPLDGRKDILNGLNLRPPFVLIKGKRLTNIKNNYLQARRKGSEGIVIKKLDSPYLIGKDAPIATHYWRKIK
jgi:ATP-dependent DNA ligase